MQNFQNIFTRNIFQSAKSIPTRQISLFCEARFYVTAYLLRSSILDSVAYVDLFIRYILLI